LEDLLEVSGDDVLLEVLDTLDGRLAEALSTDCF